MSRIVAMTLLAFLACQVCAGDVKKLSYDCEKWTEGEPPAEVFVVDGSIRVQQKDNNKVLEIGSDPLVDGCALLGSSANGSATIQARVWASKSGRSFPRFGIGVHGQSGYRLIVFCAKKELQLVKNEQVIVTVPYEWTSDAWINLKLEALKDTQDKWSIAGKAWPAGGAEPAEPQVKHADNALKGQGKCSIRGTPFSGTPIYFDDMKLEIEG